MAMEMRSVARCAWGEEVRGWGGISQGESKDGDGGEEPEKMQER